MDQSEKESHLATLKNFKPPEGFSSRAAAKVTVTKLRRGEKVLKPEDIETLSDLEELLAGAALGLASADEITLGMIKPRANEGVGLPSDDDEAAQAIIDEIGRNNVPLQFHTLLDKTQAERLYGTETITRLQKIESEYPGRSVAEVHLEFITSDPATILLVYQATNAVEWLKNLVGATRPSQAHPNSIRGRYGRDQLMPNNLVHRSGSQDEARAEILAFGSIVHSLIEFGGQTLPDQLSYSNNYPTWDT